MKTDSPLAAAYNAPRKCADVIIAVQRLQGLYRDFPEQTIAALGLFEAPEQAILRTVLNEKLT